jgi:primosomal protein N'
VDAQAFSVALLDGVTGSGKTEVYMEAVAQALSQSPTTQVLVLLPEIALTGAVIARFTTRFGGAPAAPDLGSGGQGAGANCGGRAFGAVSALRRPRPDRRR